ncbi:MAG: hypothetical protein ACE5EQ_05135 [Phycisphaerae bacterium]
MADVVEMVMMLCPSLKCRKVLRVPASCRGKQVRCQYCNMTFKVPDAAPSQDNDGARKK